MKKDGPEKKKRTIGIIILIAILIVIGVAAFFAFNGIKSHKNDVIATVNGTEIKADYLMKRMMFDGTDIEDAREILIEEQVIRQTGPSVVQISEQELQQYELSLMEARTGASDPDQLKGFLKELANASGFSVEELELLLYTGILSEKLDQYLQNHIQTVEEQVHLAVIIFDTEEALNQTLARIGEGEEFEDLAAELNESEELKANRGDLGWMPRLALQENVASSVFDEIEVGQITQPFQLGDTSYALFYLLGREEAREVDTDILESLKANALSDWVVAQKALSDIERPEITNEQESWINWQLQKMLKEYSE